MSHGGRIAAIILAAGRSSRMGASKPLLPLGSGTVVERVVKSVSSADVDDMIVVTGHDPESLAALLGSLPVRQIHNAGYEAGMFSSIRAGVAALDSDVKAFFILPVDYPLIRAEVLGRLLAAFVPQGPAVLHPTCLGRRGHPPLISGRYREALLRADRRDNLRSFLQRQAESRAQSATEVKVEVEIEVEDLTILMDMDTEEDYRRIRRFADVLDAARCPATGYADAAPRASTNAPSAQDGSVVVAALSAEGNRPPSLSFDDALHLLAILEVPDQVARHCRTVAVVGETLAHALEPYLPQLDADLVRTAGLLHDLAKGRRKHAVAGQNLLSNLGFRRLGQVVGAHMVLPPDQTNLPLLTEEKLVYLADKLVAEDRIVGLEERTAETLRNWGDVAASSEALDGMEARMQAAREITRNIEAILGLPLAQVLRPLKEAAR